MFSSSRIREFSIFALKVIVAHTATYFIFGLAMSQVFDYGALFEKAIIRDYMRPIDSANVLMGPFIQPLRGLLFAIALWPIREMITVPNRGWRILWMLIVIVGILSTPSAAPASIEGLIYSRLPLWYHLIGLPEMLGQTLAFSLIVSRWTAEISAPPESSPPSKPRRQLTYLVTLIMVACFGYIGYAIGGLLTAQIAGVTVDIKKASLNIEGQMMFIVAFLVNIIAIHGLGRAWLRGKLNGMGLFLLFWAIDALVLILYQTSAGRSMPLHFALLMGFFPAIIITASLLLNRKNLTDLTLENPAENIRIEDD